MKARSEGDSSRSAGIRLEHAGGVATITLARPERHNALGAEQITALLEYLDTVEQDESVRVVVLTGAGDRTFCAGASLDEMESGAMDEHRFETATDRLAALDRPTICALNGNAYGGGAELALCCDFRVGMSGMKVAVPAARLGVCYPPGGLRRYAHRLGYGAAARLFLAAEEMDAEELYRVGFLTHLVSTGEVKSAVDDLAGRIASLAPLAVRGMKEILRGALDGAVPRDEANALVERAAQSDDLREGLAARREGREPDFRGR